MEDGERSGGVKDEELAPKMKQYGEKGESSDISAHANSDASPILKVSRMNCQYAKQKRPTYI